MLNLKRGIVVACGLSVAFSPFLVACGSTPASSSKATGADGKIDITFWSFWGSKDRRPVIQKIVDDFNKSQDKIHVKYVYLPWGDVWTKELAAVTAGDPPDVIIQDINSVQTRAQKKQAMDLSPYLKQDNIQSEFYPNLWKSVTYKGDAYGIPFNTDTRLLFYNKDMFKAAGLNPNSPPQTVAELDADAKKLDKKVNGKYQVVGYYPLWGGFGADSWLLSADNGVSYLNYQTQKAEVDTPNKQAAIKWINSYNNRLGLKNIETMQSSFSNGSQANPFAAGKVAMWTDTPTSVYTQIRDYAPNLNFGVAPIPSWTAGSKHYSWGGGFDAEIPVGSKHPDAAWQFIKYLTGEKAQEYWAAKCFDNVANIKGAEAAAKDPTLGKKGQMVYQAAIDNMKNNVYTPVPTWAPGYPNIVEPEIQAATTGHGDPMKELQQAQQALEQLITENKQ